MTDDRHQRLAAWFDEASRLAGAERDACLERFRSEDAALADELCELLDHDTRGSGALDAGIDSAAVAALAAEVVSASDASETDVLAPGHAIGSYSVARCLGSGGFAVVYEARQSEPVTRDVALKVLRSGVDSKQVQSRFAAELQAQARLSHEHVARVFDAGTTTEGRPYLAMELVEGRPITQWCDVHRLGLRARLRLFLQVCDGVQHAHQKGIIHRDLKPSNVLVADGVPGSVKIIDFGIAKAIEGTLTEGALRTQEGQFLGTPEYMSPEQAGRAGDDIDTRTDVYSLGVLLYELLAGNRPFDFADMPLHEVHRVIHEVDPPRPSQRLAIDSAEADWERALRSDLDWVVMRAIEKDAARRYEAVAGLADDVRRFLRDEPIDASPPSQTYRLRKFVRRNRASLTAGALVIFALVVGLVWALIERGRADDAREQAQARAAELGRVGEFQEEQFTSLDPQLVGDRIRAQVRDELVAAIEREQGDVDEELARFDELLLGTNFTNVAAGVLDETFLSNSVATIEERYADDPAIQARLLRSVGAAQRSLGLTAPSVRTLESAVELATRAFGAEHPLTLAARLHLADVVWLDGDFARAQSEYESLLQQLDASAVLERSRALAGLAKVADSLGDTETWRRLRHETYELVLEHYGPQQAETLVVRAELAAATIDPEVADEHYLAAIEGSKKLYGERHTAVLRTEENYAGFLESIGRRREALELRTRAVDAFRGALGDRHRTTLRSIEGLGLRHYYDANYEEALVWMREAYDGRVEAYGVDDIQTIGTAGNLAMVLGHLGRNEEALELYERVLPAQRAVVGLEHEDTLGTMTNQGVALLQLGRLEEAAEVLEESLALKRRVLGEEHAFTWVAVSRLAEAYRGLERHDEARALFREHLEYLKARAKQPDATAEQVGFAAERLLFADYPELIDPPLALELAKRAVELEEAHGGALLYRQLQRVAAAHWFLNDPQTGYEVQQRVVEIAPEHAQSDVRAFLKNFEDRLARESEVKQ